MEHIRAQLEENEKGFSKKRLIREEVYQSGSVLETELLYTVGLRRGYNAVQMNCKRTHRIGVPDTGSR